MNTSQQTFETDKSSRLSPAQRISLLLVAGLMVLHSGTVLSNADGVLANIEGGPRNYTENGPPVPITSTLTVSDGASPNVTEATVQIVGNYAIFQDQLSFVNAAPITGVFDALTGTLRLSGTDSLANYQAALRSVTYSNTSDNPSTLTRTVGFQIINSAAANLLSNVATRDIAVTAVNDPPSISHITDQSIYPSTATGPLAFQVKDPEADGAAALYSNVTTPLNKTYFAGNGVEFGDEVYLGGPGRVITDFLFQTFLSDHANGNEKAELFIRKNDGGTSANAPGTLIYSSGQFNLGRGFQVVTLPDVLLTVPNPFTWSVIMTGIDAGEQAGLLLFDPPTVGASFDDFWQKDLSGVWSSSLIDGGATRANFAAEAAAATSLTVVGTSDNLSLVPNNAIVVTGQGLNRTVTVTPLANASGTARITLTVSDGQSGSASDSFLVNVGNFAPALANIESAPLSFTEFANPQTGGSVTLTQELMVQDPVSPTLTGATVQIIGNYAIFQDQLLCFGNNPNITVVFDELTGTLRMSGTDTLENYQALLRTVDYKNTSQNPSTLIRTVGFQVINSAAVNPLSNVATRNIAVTAVNNAPTISFIRDRIINVNSTTGPLAFEVKDPEADGAAALYSNVTTPLNKTYFAGNGVEFGDEVFLGGPGRVITDFLFQTFLSNNANGNEKAELFIRKNDGGTSASAPGTLIYRSGEFNLGRGFQVVTLPDVLLTVPNPFTWSVIMTGIDPGEQAGLLLFDPPTVGASFDDFWQSDLNGVWFSSVIDGGATKANFAAEAAAATALTVIGTSDNLSLVPNNAIVVTGQGLNRTVTVTPLANASGTARITLTVSDGQGGSATSSFSVAVPNTKYFTAFLDKNSEVPPTTSIGVGFGDFGLDGTTLRYQISYFDLTGPATGAHIHGPALPGSNAGVLFPLTIEPGASPSGLLAGSLLNLSSTQVDDLLAGKLYVNIHTAQFPNGEIRGQIIFVTNPSVADKPPIVTEIRNQRTFVGNIIPAFASFTIGDLETPADQLIVRATSEDQTLLPDSNIVITGTGNSRTVTMTPAAGQTGTADISIEVVDSVGNSAAANFVLRVGPALKFFTAQLGPVVGGAAPLLASTGHGSGKFVLEGNTLRYELLFATLSGKVTGAELRAPALTVGGEPLALNIPIFGDLLQNGRLFGSVVLTSDLAGQLQQGVDKVVLKSSAFVAGELEGLIVTQASQPLADEPPFISFIPNQRTFVSTPRTISFAIGDLETASAQLVLAKGSDNAALVPNQNVVITTGTGNERTVTITPVSGQEGQAKIIIQVLDVSGNSAIVSFLLRVSSPGKFFTTVLTPVIGVNSQGHGNGKFFVDGGTLRYELFFGDLGSHVTAAEIRGPALTPGGQPVVVNLPLPGSVLHDSRIFGSVAFSSELLAKMEQGAQKVVLKTDAFPGGEVEGTITLQASLPLGDDPPVIGLVPNQRTFVSTPRTISFWISDLETAPEQLVVEAHSDNPALVPDQNIVFGPGIGHERSVTITPVSGQTGQAGILVQLRDATGNVGGTFFVLRVSQALKFFEAQLTPGQEVPPTDSAGAGAGQFVLEGTTLRFDIHYGDLSGDLTRAQLQGASEVLSQNLITDVTAFRNSGRIIGSLSLTPTQVTELEQGRLYANLHTQHFPNGEIRGRITALASLPTEDDPPAVSFIPNQRMFVNQTRTISFVVSDLETPADQLLVHVHSGFPDLVPETQTNLGLTGSGHNRSLTITPLAGQTGETFISIEVLDVNGHLGHQGFTLRVTPPQKFFNAMLLPVAGAIPAGNAPGDSPLITPTVPTGQGAGKFVVDGNTLRYEISFGGSHGRLIAAEIRDSSGLLVVNLPIFGQLLSNGRLFGSVALTTDQIGQMEQGLHKVVLKTEGFPNGELSGSILQQPVVPVEDDPPAISQIPDQRTFANTPRTIAFVIGDLETGPGQLVLEQQSDNPTLVPPGNIVFGTGVGHERTVTITPAVGQVGQTGIRLIVKDANEHAAIRSFNLRVTPPVSFFAATLTGGQETPPVTTMAQSTGKFVLDGSVLRYDIPYENLSSGLVAAHIHGPAQAGTAAPALHPLPVPTGSLTERLFGSVELTPSQTTDLQQGRLYVNLHTANFPDGEVRGQILAASQPPFVDDPPMISFIPEQRIFVNTGRTIQFAISDLETPTSQLVLEKNSSNPTLIPLNNIVFGAGPGIHDRTVTITPVADGLGESHIAIVVKDGNGTQAFRFFTVTVTPPLKFFSASLNGAQQVPPNNSVGSGTAMFVLDVNTVRFDVFFDRLNTELFEAQLSGPAAAGAVGSLITALGPPTRSFNQARLVGTMLLPPERLADFVEGRTYITLRTQQFPDGEIRGQILQLTSPPTVDEPPFISAIPDQRTVSGVATQPLTFEIADLVTPVEQLKISWQSSNPALVPNDRITVEGFAHHHTVTVNPLQGQTGSADIALTVMDNVGRFATRTFTITVVPPPIVVNDAAGLAAAIAAAGASGTTIVLSGNMDLSTIGAITKNVTFSVGSGVTLSGTLQVGSGGTVSLGGGNFPGASITVASGGTLTGSGSFNGTLVVLSGGKVSPGVSPGTITADNGTWSGGGSYDWEITNASGAPGTTDLLVFNNALTVTATSGDRFIVRVKTLTAPNQPGVMAGFDPQSTYAWTIGQAGSVVGFDASAFTLDTTGVVNEVAGGRFGIRQSGANVQVTFRLVAPTVTFATNVVVVLEDSAAYSSGTAFAAEAGSVSNLTHTVTATNLALFGVPPTINPAGELTFTPAPNANGNTAVTVVSQHSSSTGRSTNTFTISVREVNDAPVTTPDTQQLQEDTILVLAASSLTINDAAGPQFETDQALIITQVSPLSQAGGTVTLAQGSIAYSPPPNFFGTDTFTYTVTDNGLSAGVPDPKTAVGTVTINVVSVNDAPTVTEIPNQQINEGNTLAFRVLATDADGAGSVLAFGLAPGAPPGANINPTTGDFSWTPTEAQGPGTFQITAQVTDNAASPITVSRPFSVTVNEVNLPPSLATIGSQTISEGSTLTFLAAASDADLPANNLSFNLGSNPPPGASINSNTGLFSWTPTESQGPGTFNVTIQVSDNATSNPQTDSRSFTVSVLEVNQAPTLAPIGSQTIAEGLPLSVTATANDPDFPSNSLTFSLLAGAPAGASINPATGVFTWTPTEAQGPGSYTISIQVADNGSPSLTAVQSFSVNVTEFNSQSVISLVGPQTINEGSLLTVTLTATDPDTPPNIVTFTLEAGAPAGASISPTGVFTWTPSEAQGPGNFTIGVRATDNGSPALSATQSFTVAVNEVNALPVLGSISSQTISELSQLTFSVTATDSDQPPNILSFQLGAGAPPGASINPATGVFTWTPSEAQGPGSYPISVQVSDNTGANSIATQNFTVTVNEVNAPPSLVPMSDRSIKAGETLNISVSATDPDSPANVLAFSLDSSAPVGATINPTTGAFTWTPPLSAETTSAVIAVKVSDNGTPSASDTKSFTVAVNASNKVPLFPAIAAQTVDEGKTLTLTIAASDPDQPPNRLSYKLGAGAPVGMSIDATTGVLTWTPTEVQGPSVATVSVQVSDDGTPPLSAVQSVAVTVNEVNTPPVLAAIANGAIRAGDPLSLIATATDLDLPANTISYSLSAGAPAGASIDPTTGVFTWTPALAQGGTTNVITVAATDNGTPRLNDTKNFTVIVTPSNTAPVFSPAPNQTVNEGSTLTFNLTVRDADLPANQLTYTLGPGAPAGASIGAGGVLSWTPNETQGPSSNTIRVRVTDDGIPPLSAEADVIVVVNEVNSRPDIGPISNQTVIEGQLLTFTVSATDPDIPSNAVQFSFTGNVPAGANINPITGVVTWSPTELQGPSTNVITVVATDNGLPSLSTNRVFTVVVVEDNVAPVLRPIGVQTVNEGSPVSFTAAATDSDQPPQVLTFSLVAGAPSGASINPATGAFAWATTEANGPSTNTVRVRVSDNGLLPRSVEQDVVIVVNEINAPPTMGPIANQTIKAGESFAFTASAADPDLPANILQFSLGAGAPAGAGINPTTGLFSWSPSAAQTPSTNVITVLATDNGTPALSANRVVTLVVVAVNRPPVLALIPPQTVAEGSLLTFTASATDLDLPAQILTYSLGPGAPSGASINPLTGVFTWTPTELQGPSNNVVVIRVTDSSPLAERATQDVAILVTEVNTAPVLKALSNQTIGLGDTITLPASATDADLPLNILTFSLDPGAPVGASINPTTGVFTWTPTLAQAPSTNQVTLRVTDNGSPVLSDNKSFAIVVRAGINLPPTISSISSQTTKENTPTAPIIFTINDADTPIANLTVVATSSNPTLVPVGNITFSGAGVNRTLTINPAANQNGTASITVTVQESTGGKASASFNVVVTPVAPAITRQPQNVELVPGNQASFSVSATGSQPLTFQWRFNGTAISDATNSVLSLKNVQETDEGIYTVELKNSVGSITSAEAKLTANIPLRINMQPISQSVLGGANVTFVVTASGRGPLTYQWRFNGSALAGANTPSLVLQNVDATKAGDYTAVVGNASGSVTSVVAKLEVKVPVVIATQPQSQIILQGANVSFTVVASGTPPLAYQWQLNGVDLPGQTNPGLSVANATLVNAGDYTVAVSNTGGSTTSAKATLTVSTPPSIVRQPQTQTALAGANVQFSVTVSGTEPLTYVWRLNGTPVPGGTGPTLSLPAVQTVSSGDYTVAVSNAAGAIVSDAANLKVTAAPTIALQPQSQTASTGESVTFSVFASGTGPFKYQWSVNGVDIPGATRFQFSLPNVKSEDAGSYAVVVSNDAGPVTSNPATLRVNRPVIITLQPASQTVTNRSSVVFTVAAVGTAPLTYQWRFNGADLPGRTSSSLSLSSVGQSDVGSYSVVIVNVAGAVTSANASLTVIVPPSIQTQPISQNVPLGANVTFSVTASGDAPLSYQWQKNGGNLAGANSSTLNIANAQGADSGSYSVVVENLGGAATSSSADLIVILPPLKSGGSAQSAPPPIESQEGSFDGGSNEGGTGLLARKSTPPVAQERWFSWKAPSGGIVTFSTAGSTFDTEMTIYRGTSPNLILIDRDDDRGGFLNSEVRFNAVQGTTYLIKVTGFGGATGRIVVGFKLQNTIQRLPVITTAPASQTVGLGADAAFTVVAEGTNLSYQWYANDAPLSNQTSARLVVSNVQETNAARYTVRITTTTGGAPLTVESLPAVLQIGPSDTAAQDKFKNSPKLSSGSELLGALLPGPIKNSGASLARGYSGSQVFSTFGAGKEPGEPNHCDVVGGASQWFTYGAPANGVLRVSTEGSSFDTLLAIYTGPGTDFQSLKVVACDNNSGKDGLTGVTSFPVTVGTVYYIAVDGVKGASGSVKLSYEFGLAPVISQQPASQSIVAGGTVTLSVLTTNTLSGVTTNIPAVSYQWLRDGLKITGQINRSLVLQNVQQANVGDYTVIVSNLAGSVTSAVAGIKVIAPVLITGQPQNQAVKAAARVNFSVIASGTPPLLYQWRFNGLDISGATNASLPILSVQASDAGSYGVVVSNGAGPVQSQAATLSITEPPRITTQPVARVAALGNPASFSVVADGAPPLSYQWRVNGVNVLNATTATLAINNVLPGDAGEYTVVVNNSVDSVVSAAARLTVNIPLTLTSLPRSQTVGLGSSAIFSVSANGSGPFAYQWQFNGVDLVGTTNANLILGNVQTNNAGPYTVFVSSPGGSLLSPPAILSVNAAPVITQQPISQVALAGDTVTFSVTATGTQPLSYQWLVNGSTIAEATSSSLVLTNVVAGEALNFTVTVSNPTGSVVSDIALLSILQVIADSQFGNGVFQFRLSVPEGKRGTVQSSTDLVTWTSLAVNPYNSGTFNVEDREAINFELRYYRVLLE